MAANGEVTERLQVVGEALIPAIAYGDAAGLPVETWDATTIKLTYGWLDRLINTSNNPYFFGEHTPGTWSDDTQLSIAVAEGLIAADGFEIAAQAETHIRAYHETPKVTVKKGPMPRGWGGSTTKSVRRLIEGVSPAESGEPEGGGNGVLMKLAPLVYWQVARQVGDEERYEQYDALTRMTHADPVALACTRLHGDVLRYLLEGSMDYQQRPQVLADFINNQAAWHEAALRLPQRHLSQAVKYLDANYLTHVNRFSPQWILSHTDAKGFYAPQTLAMAYGAFIYGAGDFEASVYTAVNLGGDTDSIASIVAAMCVYASRERIALPDDHHQLQEFQRLHDVSQRLARFALGNMQG